MAYPSKKQLQDRHDKDQAEHELVIEYLNVLFAQKSEKRSYHSYPIRVENFRLAMNMNNSISPISASACM